MNTFGLILGVSFIIIGISLLSTYKGFTEKFKDKEFKDNRKEKENSGSSYDCSRLCYTCC